MRLSRSALLLALLLAVAALAAPAGVGAAKKPAKKSSSSKVGIVDTDEDEDDDGPAAGYGDLGWITVSEFEKLDLSTNKKPIFFLLSQPWCGACKALKSSLVAAQAALAPVARDFVMVNAAGDAAMAALAARDPAFDGLGGYVPRAAFATPGGTLRPELKAPGAEPSSPYPHFYADANAVGGGLVAARARMAKAGLLAAGGRGGGRGGGGGGGDKEL